MFKKKNQSSNVILKLGGELGVSYNYFNFNYKIKIMTAQIFYFEINLLFIWQLQYHNCDEKLLGEPNSLYQPWTKLINETGTYNYLRIIIN